ncbi:MAG TPA: IS1634 family transposase [Desulfomonilaceae bacterium]|nr:IS1634 family transposase [Desulfomonilaceae bacterium]
MERYETRRIDHLGIVAGICREIGLIEQVDRQVKVSERKVSCGQAVQAMVLNALGFTSRALYLVPDYMQNRPVDLLVGEGLSAEDLNDDTLGRALEDLYEAGVTEVFAGVASHALDVYEIEHRFVHLDSSTLHVHGEYEGWEVDPGDENRRRITITEGYSKDHRPDLKQAVVSLITTQAAAIPIWLEALDGNSSDRNSFPLSVQAYCNSLGKAEQPYYVMDSAGYSEDNIKAIAKVKWLTRVPETLKQAKELVENSSKEGMQALEEGYWGKEEASEYGSIPQRWLVVYSEAAAEREGKGLERKQAKELKTAGVQWRKLMQENFSCQADAEKALERFNQKLHYHRAQAKVESTRRYPRRGRPGPQDVRQVTGYQLHGDLQPDSSALEKVSRSFGKFILATNELKPETLSSQGMLSHYKDQGISVERGFRFLKDPVFFAHSLFLKNPARIMALIMVMGLALLVFSLAERQLRLRLQEENVSVRSQTGKPTQSPTMRWVFQMFEGIDLLLILENDQVVSRQVLNLKPDHLKIIGSLGPQIQNCYSPPQ